MSRTLRNIKLGLDESLAEHLAWLEPTHSAYRILRQSVDARQRHQPHFVYSVEVFGPNESSARPRITVEPVREFHERPVIIVGAGPAGLFAALRLVERKIPCVLLEQGGDTTKRILSIGRFWRYGELDPLSNVGFGEGGAGLFSDGKLITRIKSEHIPYVMQRLVQFGGPPEIEYAANPHVGSDRIRRIIPVMRKFLQENGCEIRFNTKVSEVLLQNGQVFGVKTSDDEILHSERLILACGHSAEDMFEHLGELGVAMEGKSFAIGLRIEHPQKLINQIQYRAHSEHPKLGAANYRLAAHDKEDEVGVYSFCMCPGGYVLSCATDKHGLVSNGMSNYNRGSRFANAAMVVSLDFKRHFGEKTFAGLEFRRALERSGLEAVRSAGGTKQLPAQRLLDFMEGRLSSGEMPTSSPSGVVSARLDELFDSEFRTRFTSALRRFDQQMKGFISPEALLHGVETRTSCPIRIVRDDVSLQSVSHRGLYPTGEGAGYAGGITSAACDGIRVAEAIAASLT